MYLAPEGFYHNSLGIFKVVENGASGRRYAKKLTNDGEGNFTWEFAQGAVTRLKVNTKLSTETAAKFGALYGTCICCLRRLDNEESIALGIGPICLSKYF